ncbi:MAG: condensin complex subunit 2/barren [Olpidium bornovanus]|uniref:Condensin complex subunit 2 n=1 Tax=Olpidium bornovanus TaxID=278681 RepID=A0A8H8DG29_9FUNG|nr:MAG: condensin complex subunit 2/barren [Olpidium bornovanus]
MLLRVHFLQATRRNEKTLAKPESITADKIGTLEFSVDPLFKKTSADFDEGGAGGLLLNHLHMQRDGKIIFGACDALLDCEDEDEVNYSPAAIPQDSVDVNYLKCNLVSRTFPFLADVLSRDNKVENSPRYASLLDSIFDREICPTFASFSFGSNAQAFYIGPSTIIGRADAAQDSSFMGDDDCNPFEDQEDRDHDSFLMATSAARFDTEAVSDEDDEVDFADGNVGSVLLPGSDCRTSAATRMVNSLIAARQNGDICAYFDLVATKNWAGPENWKIRRIAKSEVMM